MSDLKRTPIFPEYKQWGGKTVDFGGWELPVQFSGVKHEHETTRTKAGLFDVSHMGEIMVQGPDSLVFLQKMVTNDISKMTPKRAKYTFMCYEDGGTIDDFIVYMLDTDKYLLVVNAANTDKDFAWLNEHKEGKVDIENITADYAQLALQGPLAEKILQRLTDTPLNEIKPFRFESPVYFSGADTSAIVSRTGYTGEDGFEIYFDAEKGRELWNLILETGKDDGVEPIGLGARDTLRFEAKLPLYGQEISETISPVEAGMKFAVKVDKEQDFIGKAALKEQVENGTERKLAGIEMIDKGIPRTDYKVFAGETEAGFVTTGTQSPTLEKNIGLAILDSKYADLGTELHVQVRKRLLKAVVIETPFYKRK
ncbi:glycine cleavage system aminomethyltransferase GcvT [Lentibacillus amyloliquefaciens]|uniref:Aminomethyltransferase n=1 Tax=Lentibacillus amyloliquefaciens TaxID=1472767 RepID=A0A0U4E5B3_9BACI|nr:glycine cleavage system aminomethyltransferase GcvT [Lentibacillus amyloliquefaciens]ALX48065.1 glycine cleavage system protein T [Lentibacillus amyloliquefaciens]